VFLEVAMISRVVEVITGFIGFALLAAFILGLTHSISTGFAGFWGGFPFAVIAVFVLILAGYDYWDECLRRRKD
jgi:sterol desaturase/sphingolipid hydroxylase (fatty acid hydroxylase superfamily)